MHRFLTTHASKLPTLMHALTAALTEIQRKLETALVATNTKAPVHAPTAIPQSGPSWCARTDAPPAAAKKTETPAAPLDPNHP